MTADVQLSIDALHHAAGSIERCQHRDRLLGQLLAFARLLRDDAVIRAALLDLEQDAFSADARRLQDIETGLTHDIERIMYELGDAYRDRNRPWRAIVDAHPDIVVKASSQLSLPMALDNIATPFRQRDAIEMSAADMIAFADRVPVLQREIAARSDSSLTVISRYLEQLEGIVPKCRALQQFRAHCVASSVSEIATRFGRLLAAWELCLALGPTTADWQVPNSNGLECDASTLASRIELFLNSRRSRRLVLFRAKVYFEHFFCKEARATLNAEEQRVAEAARRGERAQAQREKLLRRDLDRFIFQEGFFPITEANASRGNLDMLLADAARAGVRPLVAEIKQATSIAPDDVGHARVRAAIDEARREIARYAGNLRSRPGWQNIEPIVVVFHTSIEDVRNLQDDSTILIDIGSRSPSQLLEADEAVQAPPSS